MTSGSTNWKWPEVEPVLVALSGDRTELVLCGGQAVAFWAQRYGIGAVVSQDVDLMGDREDARRAAELLKTSVHYPGRYDMTVLTAMIRVQWEGKLLTIEWLNSVPGIETDPETISEKVVLKEDRSLRVLHPVALAISKLHALRFFDQEERRDAEHLRIVLKASALWLGELLEGNSARALRYVHQWSRVARVAGARRVLTEQGIDWKEAIPLARLEELAAADALVGKFLKEHWPRLVE